MLGTGIMTSAPLMDSGLDSLGALELREEMNAAFCIELPSTAVFDYPTIDSLTSLVTAEISERMDDEQQSRMDALDALGCANLPDSGLTTTSCPPLASLMHVRVGRHKFRDGLWGSRCCCARAH